MGFFCSVCCPTRHSIMQTKMLQSYRRSGVVIVLVFLFEFTVARMGKTVRTQSGEIHGSVSLSRLRKEFYSWKGIPYAEPPVGRLRYEDPKPVKPWNGTYIAISYGPFCLQPFGNFPSGNEDCLHLNVFTPSEAFDAGESLPVMIFFHGGEFEVLAGESFGPEYFMDEQVVLVTVNYRLNSFGFLSTGDTVVRGNMGLKDQVMAMRWVKDNIRSFAGDPERITIFGESAGAASVHYHMLSPLSKGLFHRAISESGTAISPWAFNADPRNQTKTFAEKVNCPTDSSTEMVACLRERSVWQIIAAQRKTTIYGSPEVPPKSDFFLPTVEAVDNEHAFLAAPPMEYIKAGNVSCVPWMVGVNSAEGVLFTASFKLHSKLRKHLHTDWSNAAQVQLMLSDAEKANSQAIREFYFGNRSLRSKSDEILADYTKLTTDRHYAVPFYKAASAHARIAPTFAYYYSKPTPSIYNILLKVPERGPRFLGMLRAWLQNWIDVNILHLPAASKLGVGHGDELLMLAPFLNLYYVGKHHDDFQFSRDMVKLWTDFASGRNLLFRGLNFKSLKPDDEDPYVFNLDEQPKLLQLGLHRRVQLWDSIVPHL